MPILQRKFGTKNRLACLVAFLFLLEVYDYSNVNAGDLNFHKGDAFFQSFISKDRIGVRTNESEIRFKCYRAGRRSLMTSELGNAYLVLVDADPKFEEHVRSALQLLPLEGEETGWWLMIYNSEFQPLQKPIGLRYNEKWIDPVFHLSSDYYPNEWDSSDAVIEDLRYATLVSELNLSDMNTDALNLESQQADLRISWRSVKCVIVKESFFKSTTFATYRRILSRVSESVIEGEVIEGKPTRFADGDDSQLQEEIQMGEWFDTLSLNPSYRGEVINMQWIEIDIAGVRKYSTGFNNLFVAHLKNNAIDSSDDGPPER